MRPAVNNDNSAPIAPPRASSAVDDGSKDDHLVQQTSTTSHQSHRQPLLASNSIEGEGGYRQPAATSSRTGVLKSADAVADPRVSGGCRPPAAAADDDDDEGAVPASAGVTASLIAGGKHASSNASLDSYDRTKNPFFAD